MSTAMTMRRVVVCGVSVMGFGLHIALAQPFRKEVYAIPMSADGIPIEHPFSAGFYNPSHQFVDIDADGDLDLFLYDFNDASFQMYNNIGAAEAPQFRWERPSFTVPSLMGWFRFADINGDSRYDLLTGGNNNAVAVYLNSGTSSLPQFSLLTTGVRDSTDNLVYSQSLCIPALADMDGDGDLDFLSLNPGIGTINYYQNIGSSAQFRLAFRTDRYQNVQICPGCNGQTNVLHGQGTMYFADVDADLDFDMFYGDLFDEGIFFYRNVGTPTNAILDSVSGHFPAANPVITNGFNQPTLVDIDGDNDLDLFVSVLPSYQQVHTLWFYRNIGDSTNYDFALITRDYLSTFDVGIQSTPALIDIDDDQDLDLFVGDLYGHVGFVRNIGTTVAPSFSYSDTFFVGFSNHYGYAPAFADLDGDGDYDMFLGHFPGNIEFHRNVGTEMVPIFQRQVSVFDSLNVGNQSYAAPTFFDIDSDGDLDLFVGKQDGRISFYRNNGTHQTWQFLLESTSFANVAVGFNSRPIFADGDNDGDPDLLVGASDGKLFLYRNDGPPGNPGFVLANDSYAQIDIALEVSPAMGDIDGDGDQDLMAGNLKGGVEFYRNELVTSVEWNGEEVRPEQPGLFQNYPNPFNPLTVIRYEVHNSNHVTVRISDVLGKEITVLVDDYKQPGTYTVSWDGTNGAGASVGSGIYFCRMVTGSFVEVQRMILLK